MGAHAQGDLAAGTDQDHVGLTIGRVGQDVSPLCQAGGRGVLGPVQGGEVLAGQDEHRGLVVKLRDQLPGPRQLHWRHTVGSPGAREPRQRRNLLDRLMGRSILAHPDRVMREDVDDRQLHYGG